VRARYPDRDGYLDRNGARIYFEIYENDGPTVFLGQSWQILPSRHWKMQIPYLSRHFRVVTFDPVGNGKSDRSDVKERYRATEVMADAIAVLDATGTETCVGVGLSLGGALVTYLAAFHPERFDGIVPIAPSGPWMLPNPNGSDITDSKPADPSEAPVGWEKYDPDYWLVDYPDFVDFFFDQAVSDPHSTKLIDDTHRWAFDTTGAILNHTNTNEPSLDVEELEQRVRAIDVPVLIIHGTDDRVTYHESSAALQKMILDSELALVEGAGHIPIARYPVKVNHLIKDFVDRLHGIHRPQPAWHISSGRPKKVLYISSPIGLGHATRDVAIADELRKIHPDLQVDWLAQDPVTRVLDARDETIHPASRHLASETAHLESESGEHDLNAFLRGYAHEGLARAALVAGDGGAVAEHVAAARALAAQVASAEDRALLEQDLDELDEGT